MIIPPGIPGVAFGTNIEGDARSNSGGRAKFATALHISQHWATITQVHGSAVVFADASGHYGDADGIVTDVPGLPIVIATADCVPVVLIASQTRAVVHAGWRGVAEGVVVEAMRMIERRGDTTTAALIGPHIGSCCYEVGDEVVEAIGGFAATTRTGTTSADLARAIRSQLGQITVTDSGICTHDAANLASYRENGTTNRQVTVAWIPQA
jgi:hypothetical protein